MLFAFGDHVLDPLRRELRRGTEPVALEPQVFDLPLYLIANRDRVVTKDDLIDSVRGGRIVSDSALTTRIAAARRAIGDTGEAQTLIRTVARKGFRFVGAVREDPSNAAPGPGLAVPSPSDKPRPSPDAAAGRLGSLANWLADARAWTERAGLDDAAERFCGLWLMFWPNLNYDGAIGGVIGEICRGPDGLETRWWNGGSGTGQPGRCGPGFVTGHQLFCVNTAPRRNRTFGALILVGTERKAAILDGIMTHPVGPRVDCPMACRVICLRLADAEPGWETGERRFWRATDLLQKLNGEGWEHRLPAVLREIVALPGSRFGVLIKPEESASCVAEQDLMTPTSDPRQIALRSALREMRAIFSVALVPEGATEGGPAASDP